MTSFPNGVNVEFKTCQKLFIQHSLKKKEVKKNLNRFKDNVKN